MGDYWYLDGMWYRKDSPQWEMDLHGTNIASAGDLIFNNIAEYLDGNIEMTNKEAESLLNQSLYLLNAGKRWPDRMTPVQPEGAIPYRKQSSVTRDPWILCYTLAVKLNKIYLIKAFKPQVKLRIPSFMFWRKYLITGKAKYLTLYYLFTLNYPRKEFVRRLRGYMNKAVELKQKQQ